MDLDQLQSVRDRERDSESLQELRASFYEEAIAYVQELRDERKRAASEAAEPFDDPRVNRLTDRIRTAEGTLEAIYEKRVGKILTAATLAAADFATEIEGMTTEEADLYEGLVAEIQANRQDVLGQLGADADADIDPTASGPDQSPAGDTGGETAADDPDPDDVESATASDAEPSDAGSTDEAAADEFDRTRVRITDDVGPILGVDDREYDLVEDDVVTLPTANARPLVERGVAERLE